MSFLTRCPLVKGITRNKNKIIIKNSWFFSSFIFLFLLLTWLVLFGPLSPRGWEGGKGGARGESFHSLDNLCHSWFLPKPPSHSFEVYVCLNMVGSVDPLSINRYRFLPARISSFMTSRPADVFFLMFISFIVVTVFVTVLCHLFSDSVTVSFIRSVQYSISYHWYHSFLTSVADIL